MRSKSSPSAACSDRRVRDADAALVEDAEQVARHPVGRELAVAPARNILEIVRMRLLGDEQIGLRGAQAIVGDEARLLRVRKLGQARADFLDPALVENERQEIGVGEIAVIVRLFLAAHRPGDAARGIEEPRLLFDRAAIFQELDLAARLVLDRLHREPDRIDVLDLAARAEGGTRTTHRDVGVAAQAPLLHVAVARAEIAQDGAQLAQICPRLLRAS